MKRIIVALLITAFIAALTGCNSLGISKSDNTAVSPQDKEYLSADAGDNKESNSAYAADSPEVGQPLVRSILSDFTNENFIPLTGDEYNTYCNSYEAFKMLLYEMMPDVFEGEATYYVSLEDDGFMNEGSSLSRYRTGRVRLTPGEEENITLFYTHEVTHIEYDWETTLGSKTRHYYSSEYVNYTWLLSIDGDTVKLYFGADDTEPYKGECRMSPLPEKTPAWDGSVGKVISINSDGRGPQGHTDGHEYRGVLTAKPTGNNEYAVNLFVYGDSPGIPFCDEDVSFIMQDFDEKMYKEAGGVLPVSADAMGAIHASAGDYIVFLDEDRLTLEAANSDVTFLGRLIPESEVQNAKYIADETKPITRDLYDATKEKATGAFMEDGIPGWHLPSLMPKPIEPGYWRYNAVADTGGYNFYTMQYGEVALWPDEIVDNYKAQLEGIVDDLYAVYDEETHYGIVRFSKGAYCIYMRVEPPFGSHANIVIYIIH